MEKNLGHATAYGYAKSKGYSGTEDEFAELMADYASVGQSAAQSAEQAAASASSASGSAATATQAAQTATSKASEAVTAADAATTKASEASTSASTASSAATSASTSAQTATTAATTATTKASEASESATTATTAKTDAESARDAAAQSASEAAESARTLTIDDTLTQSGQAADAKAVGDEISDLKSDFELAVPIYPVSKDSAGYVWVENPYPNGTVLTWENRGDTNNILIGHYESDKTTRIGANTVIKPGKKTNITIPTGNIAYIAVYFYGAGIASYNTLKGVYRTINDLANKITPSAELISGKNYRIVIERPVS